jgi:hypothetical protein
MHERCLARIDKNRRKTWGFPINIRSVTERLFAAWQILSREHQGNLPVPTAVRAPKPRNAGVDEIGPGTVKHKLYFCAVVQ